MEGVATLSLLFGWALVSDILTFCWPTKICSTPIIDECERCNSKVNLTFGLRLKLLNPCSECNTQIQYTRLPVAHIGVFVISFLLLIPATDLYLDFSNSVIMAVLLLVSTFDFNYHLIPNKVLLLAFVAGILAMIGGVVPVWNNIYATLTITTLIIVLRWGSRRFLGRAGIGIGDLKLLATLALFASWDILWISYLGFLLGGLWGVIGLLTGAIERNTRIPLAPFLLAGFLTFILLEPWVTII